MADSLQAPLRVGFDNPFEPFSWIVDGEPRGMVLDLVAAILDQAGMAHVFVPLALEVIEQALLEDRIDAIASKGVTPERKSAIDFSTALLVTGGAIFVRAGDRVSADLRDFAGKTVVTPRRGPLYAQIERSHPELRLVDGLGYPGSFEAVLDGKADFAVLNWQAGIHMVNQRYAGRFALPVLPYVAVDLAFAVPKGRRQDLLRRFGEAQVELTRSGELARIGAKWLSP